MHYLASGHRAHEENHLFVIQEFISSLETNLRQTVAKKCEEQRSRSNTLQEAFTLAVEMSGKIQEAESFECDSSYKLLTDVNKICRSTAEINKGSHGCWNNNNHGGKSGGYKGNKP